MELNSVLKEDIKMVAVKGDMDSHTSPKAREFFAKVLKEENKKIIIDLTSVPYISSAGLASLHIVTKMFRDEKADPEDVWDTFKKIDRDRERGIQNPVKLLNPSPEVDNVLDMLGFKQFFEIYTDLEEAIGSF